MKGILTLCGMSEHRGEADGYPIDSALSRSQRIKLFAVRTAAIIMSYLGSLLGSFFWQQSMSLALIQIFKDQEIDVPRPGRISIQVIASIFALTKLLADVISANPVYVADKYMFIKRRSSDYSVPTRILSLVLRLISLFFIYSLMNVMLVLPFIRLSDGLNKWLGIENTLSRAMMVYPIFAITMMFELSYCWFLDKENIETSVSFLVDSIDRARRNIKKVPSYTDRLLETGFCNFVRACFAATLAFFLVVELSKQIFNINPLHILVKVFAGLAALATLLLTSVKYLPGKIRKEFNPAYIYEEMSQGNASFFSVFKRYVTSLVRAVAVASISVDFVDRHITKSLWVLFPTGIILSMLVCTHAYVYKDKMAMLEGAVNGKFLSKEHLLSVSTSSQSLQMMPSESTYSLSTELSLNPLDRSDLFLNLVAENTFRPNIGFRAFASIASISAQLLQIITAYLFLSVINTSLAIGLRSFSLLAIGVLFAEMRFSEDKANTEDSMCNRWRFFKAAKTIENNRYATNARSSFFGGVVAQVKSTVGAFLASDVQYPTTEIERVSSSLSRVQNYGAVNNR